MIDSRAFRRTRRRVVAELAPQFEEQGNCYSLISPNLQIHCVEFGSARREKKFCVDFGWHFAFAPSFEAFWPAERLVHPSPCTCCLNRRWRDSAGNQFLPYGQSEADAENLVRTIITEVLEEFHRLDQQCGDGASLLPVLTPEALLQDVEVSLEIMACSDFSQRDEISNRMHTRKLFPGWFPQIAPMSLLLACVSWHAGCADLVPTYIRVAQHESQARSLLPKTKGLVEDVTAGRLPIINSQDPPIQSTGR
jgi:hypothetical protein